MLWDIVLDLGLKTNGFIVLFKLGKVLAKNYRIQGNQPDSCSQEVAEVQKTLLNCMLIQNNTRNSSKMSQLRIMTNFNK